MARNGESWDRGVVKLLVKVADTLESGGKVSQALSGVGLPVGELVRLDRLSVAPDGDVARLLALWRALTAEEREEYMWRVLGRWKELRGYVS